MKISTLVAYATALASPFVSAQSRRGSDFAVPGTSLPGIPFNPGPSFAGTLPVANTGGDLFFWYWPTSATNSSPARESLIIWLGGGPGSTSLTGMLQQSGPILFTPPSSPSSNTSTPTPNPSSWHHLTNVLYLDQPIGSGLSASGAPPTATSLLDIADQFLSFWSSFAPLFLARGTRKSTRIYLAGESYAARYMTAIANRAREKRVFDVSGMLLLSPLLADPAAPDEQFGSLVPSTLQNLIPVVDFIQEFRNELPLGDDVYAQLNQAKTQCGHEAYLQRYLVFPPAGPQPPVSRLPGVGPGGVAAETACGLGIAATIIQAATAVSPCFDPYYISSACPPRSDVAVQAYFNRADVQAALHVPRTPPRNAPRDFAIRTEASVFVDGKDTSPAILLGALGAVVDRCKNVVVAGGGRDGLFPWEGMELALQNMTWGGQMGFRTGLGQVLREERGLGAVKIPEAGHFVARDAPKKVLALLKGVLAKGC